MQRRELTFDDVVGWLRDQSRKFSEMADQIESTFSSATNGQATVSAAANFGAIDNVFRIKEVLSDGVQRRAPEIAERARINEDVVRQVIEEHPELFDRGERGWIGLKQ
jgi:hypothetical protein